MRTLGALPTGSPRAALLDAVRAGLDATLPRRARVVLAVSGGPDSTAMAAMVTEARPDLRPVIAHVRHGLRDDRPDARAAAGIAAVLGLAVHERAVTVVPTGAGPEAAARTARHRALVDLARDAGAGAVLLGHTADDRAETLLLNLARGTGLRGLAGMRLRSPSPASAGTARVDLIRPLLVLRRSDVRAFLAGEGLSSATDPTNRDPEQRRQRVRSEVLPALARLSGGSGDPVGALARLADLAAADAEVLDTLAEQELHRLVRRWGPARAVRRRELVALPPALATRVLRLALAEVAGGQAPPAAAVYAVLDLRPGQALDVAGAVRVTNGGGWLAALPEAVPALPTRVVAVPGRTELTELAVALHVDVPPADRPGQRHLPLPGLVPDEDRTVPPEAPFAVPPGAELAGWAALPGTGRMLVVRARRPGERIQLPAGSRKVQDVLVDAGVPRVLRRLVPVVADEDDQALWLPGLALRAGPPGGRRCWLAPLPGGSGPGGL